MQERCYDTHTGWASVCGARCEWWMDKETTRQHSFVLQFSVQGMKAELKKYTACDFAMWDFLEDPHILGHGDPQQFADKLSVFPAIKHSHVKRLLNSTFPVACQNLDLWARRNPSHPCCKLFAIAEHVGTTHHP